MKSAAAIDKHLSMISQQYFGDEEIDTACEYIDTMEEAKTMTENQIRDAIDRELHDDRDFGTMTRIKAYEWALEDDDEDDA